MDLRVPGDKSLSHRALLLAALTDGESRVSGILPSEDPNSTAECLRRLGVGVPELALDGAEIRIQGRGLRGLVEPTEILNAGNSGTTARLLLGILAGQPLEAVLTGDASLRKRPMGRVVRPLSEMGARFEALEEADRLPLKVRGGPLDSLSYESPVASAQVKSALLLAGLVGGRAVSVTQPRRSRDHTERLLRALGVEVREEESEAGWTVELSNPPDRLPPLDFPVPGDFSSAAFFIALALLGGAASPLILRDVSLNPTRTGLLSVLRRMGARIEVEEQGSEVEPMGTLVCRESPLRGVDVGGEEIPDLIDEVPVLCVLAARARGRTRITGAEELRVKESDRIHALVQGLRAVGVQTEEREDGLEVEGGQGPLAGRVESFGDHRIAMAFGVLDRAVSGGGIEVVGRESARVSFPGFWTLLDRVSGQSGGGGGRGP